MSATLYHRDERITLWHGDALDVLRGMEDGSVDCVVTSPPYFNLRDYGVEGEIGSEKTVREYVENLVAIMAEVYRVLAADGTLWLNLGDSYINKRLALVPARVAIAMEPTGWVLRNDIIWAKTSGTPFAGTDRVGSRHEHIYFFTKRTSNYHYDLEAIKVPSVTGAGRPQRLRAEALAEAARLTPAHIEAIRACGMSDAGKARVIQAGTDRNRAEVQALANEAKAALGGYYREFLTSTTKNPGDVWSFATKPFPGSHMAVFPPDLPERCIRAGCKPGGVVLDPFSGSGTTGMVALREGRSYIGIDTKAEYLDLSLRTRLEVTR